MTAKAISKYLASYAQSESNELVALADNYLYVMVIPVCNEDKQCLKTVFSEIKTNNVLIIAVVNSPNSHPVWQLHNQKFIKNLENNATNQQQLNINCQLLRFKDFHDILVVDKNSQDLQINPKYGVGLARKTGCDIALRLYATGVIKRPWIFSTDADVILPANYFSKSVQNSDDYSAIVLDFQHYSDSKYLHKLQFYYDFKLRYYHAGIVFASTTYAYIPLGSTLIVNMLCYAQVRGFPKKNAGEDFYLLNKLAKIKPIKYLVDNPIVKIKSRFSNRVPFGTGPALAKISELDNINNYQYYHPRCFILLKQWIDFLNNLWQQDSLYIIEPKDKLLAELYHFFNCKNVFSKCQPQITSQTRWSQFVHQWFDAFKTLKAVHFFDNNFKRVSYQQLLNSNSFAKVNHSMLQNFIQRYDKN
ncbi:hypothetical protein MNBD_GAMMA01-268 [hydrothermal vent metagenome]|uniref:Glycosyltransferase 2-like domain-containing protein n=1 Tax=hydrothermal vent metagenome TaxID=652676 RepID=A0A3B0VMQ3_9ZZZZ